MAQNCQQVLSKEDAFIAQCKKSTLLLFDGCNNIYNRTSFCAISHGLNLAISSPRGTSSK